jgi:hypothetical protein
MTESTLKPIIAALQDAARRGLWGQIQIDFQHGEAVMLRIAETVKLPAKENNSHAQRRA